MALKGRKRRLKNFKKRAEDFAKSVEKGTGSKLAIRDRKPLDVGIGKHKRLVLKRIGHVKRAKIDQARFIKFLKENKIEPKTYSITRVASHSKLGVQEYFHRPSLNALNLFLGGGKNKASSIMQKGDAMLCKQFLNMHKDIALLDVRRASKEFFGHLRQANLLFQIEQNIIVVGRAKDGKLRLAIVDV